MKRFLTQCARTLLFVATATVAQAQVRATLVSADHSVQAGHPLSVALRLEHDSSWHTYWISAGTGYPSALSWDLSAGWKAGAIQWPVPKMIKDANDHVTGNGYEGVVDLPVILTPPNDVKPGGSATVKAEAKWLMCSDVCIPGHAAVTLSLPVAGTAPAPNESVRAEMARMPMPQLASGWALSATRAGKIVTLDLKGQGTLTSPHFFSDDAFIEYDQPQKIVANAGRIAMTLPVAEDAEAGTARLSGVLAYTDAAGVYRGFAVALPFSAPGAVAPQALAVPAQRGGSLIATLFLALLGGLILNLMPCVFPVLGIKILGFVNQSGTDRRAVTLHGIAYTIGVLLSFWALVGLLAILRASGERLGWGFQLQSAVFVYSLTALILLFALNLSGVFEFGLSATGVGSNLQTKQGYSGSFFTGVLATVVATPCSAPFLAPALGAGLALPLAQSFWVFTAIGIGLSTPYLLLAVFPQAVKVLPRPGRWMETFKQAMAFPLYATVGYLIWVLAGQTGESGLLNALFGLTVIAMAAWLYGRYRTPGGGAGRARVGLIGGLVLLLLGMELGWPRAVAATDIVWEPWSAERVGQLAASGQPVYVDFTARWCATCQANKKVVFSSADVKRYFHDHHVATLKADWTNSDPRITAELAKWNRSAVPFDLVYRKGEQQPQVLPELLTPAIVLAAYRN